MTHYKERQDSIFQYNPLEIKNNNQILKYEISVKKFGECYNFCDSEELVNDFLNNLRSKFRPSGFVLIKCGFIIENIQQCLKNIDQLLIQGIGLQKLTGQLTLTIMYFIV